VDLGRLRARPPCDARLPRSPRGNSIDAYLFIGRLVRRYGGVPIYTDGAGWYADACRWAGAEHIVYDRPLRNLMERMIQYI
jgi:transposase-like protein